MKRSSLVVVGHVIASIVISCDRIKRRRRGEGRSGSRCISHVLGHVTNPFSPTAIHQNGEKPCRMSPCHVSLTRSSRCPSQRDGDFDAFAALIINFWVFSDRLLFLRQKKRGSENCEMASTTPSKRRHIFWGSVVIFLGAEINGVFGSGLGPAWVFFLLLQNVDCHTCVMETAIIIFYICSHEITTQL